MGLGASSRHVSWLKPFSLRLAGVGAFRLERSPGQLHLCFTPLSPFRMTSADLFPTLEGIDSFTSSVWQFCRMHPSQPLKPSNAPMRGNKFDLSVFVSEPIVPAISADYFMVADIVFVPYGGIMQTKGSTLTEGTPLDDKTSYLLEAVNAPGSG